MNFYKRHIGDYIKDAGHLTLLEHGVYTRLLDIYYTREAGIPEDKAARLVGARSKDEQAALANVLDEFFTLVNGTWTQGRCEEEIEAANVQADANRNNGKKGGRPKRKQTEDKPSGNPMGFVSDNENNLSQTPDTRHQTPDIKTGGDDDSTVPDETGRLTAAPLPTREAAPISNDPAIQLSVALRRQGVNVTFTHPAVQDWAAKGVTLEMLTEAVAAARLSKGPDASIPPNYLVPIVHDLLNPPPAAAGRSRTPPPNGPSLAEQNARNNAEAKRLLGFANDDDEMRTIDAP